MSLPHYLREARDLIERIARDYGLDPSETVFEMLDYQTLNAVAAYGGFPTRYPHWRWGMEFERMSKGHVYGLHKIYEMVINNVPAYAYLLEGNSNVEQKVVMAHVFAHVDFFHHNYYFSRTNRKMIDTMANHAQRVRRHVERHGADKVESFIDACLSLDNLIDPMSPYIVRRTPPRADEEPPPEVQAARMPAKGYMDKYINPPEVIEAERRKAAEEAEKTVRRLPAQPERDVLQFLIEHARLDRWERDIVEIVREEAYYFAPQAMTKIMNEGWASFWHSRIMTDKVLGPDEIIDYADTNAGVLAAAPGQLNPYKLGVELFRHIEERWDKGRFGLEWERCDDYAQRRAWDRRLGLGREKLFEVRRHCNDVTFLDQFFTEEFCREQRCYQFGWNERETQWEIQSREFRKVKDTLLFHLTNLGHPFILVDDANYKNRGELLLVHRHEGIDLKLDYARDVLANLEKVWRRPVNLLTEFDGKRRILRCEEGVHSDAPAPE